MKLVISFVVNVYMRRRTFLPKISIFVLGSMVLLGRMRMSLNASSWIIV
jgi:hypothetical protein